MYRLILYFATLFYHVLATKLFSERVASFASSAANSLQRASSISESMKESVHRYKPSSVYWRGSDMLPDVESPLDVFKENTFFSANPWETLYEFMVKMDILQTNTDSLTIPSLYEWLAEPSFGDITVVQWDLITVKSRRTRRRWQNERSHSYLAEELKKCGIGIIDGQISYFDDMLKLHQSLIKPTDERSQRYRVVSDVPGDGSCFFYSFSQQLNVLRQDWMPKFENKDLRTMIVDTLREYPDKLSGFIHDLTFEDYVKNMSEDQWADDLAITILSALLGVKIVIFRQSYTAVIDPKVSTVDLGIPQSPEILRMWLAYSGTTDTFLPEDTVYVGHLGESHYVIVAPVSEEEAAQYDVA